MHRIFCIEMFKLMVGLPVIVFVAEPVQPSELVTVTEYTPAGSPEIVWVLAPFDHAKVKGAVPKVTFAVSVPLLALPQTKLEPVIPIFRVIGCVTVELAVAVQPAAFVTVTV